MKKYEEAIRYYERTAIAPPGPGNILRSKWLRKAANLEPPAAPIENEPEKKEPTP